MAALKGVLSSWFVLGCTTGGQVLSVSRAVDAGEEAAEPDAASETSVTEGVEQAVVFDHASAVAAGTDHTCVLQDQRVYCSGANGKGQLGRSGAASSTLQPSELPADIDRLVLGYEFTCVVSVAGRVACFGSNERGQLASPGAANSERALTVDLPAPVSVIGTKFGTVCVVLEDGGLSCWGANENNQCGTGEFAPDGKVEVPTTPNFPSPARSVASGRGHTCVSSTDSALWCWGSNGSLELGLGPDAPGLTLEPERVSSSTFSAVAPGQNHTCAIASDGRLHCWGDMLGADGHPGPMGHDDGAVHDVPTPVGEDTDWKSISTDTFHSCGVRGEGELWCWGRNAEGQLGVGSYDVVPGRVHVSPDERFRSVAVGRFHTCALREDGAVLCAGKNENGELATGDQERRSTLTLVDQFRPQP